MKKDFVRVGILWFSLTFVGELLAPALDIFPVRASEEGEIIDEAFQLLMVLGIPVFTFVVSVMIYSIFRFRVSGGETSDAEPDRGSNTVYTIWLAVTSLLAIAVLIHPGMTGVAALRSNPSAELVVQVVGEKWNWDFTYVQYGVTIEKADQLVLPVDTRVKFEVTSDDILHSFWVPAFRMKIDAVPGLTTDLYITPNRVGFFEDDAGYRLQCAELCGSGHTRMHTEVVVLEIDEFEKWISSQLVVGAETAFDSE